MSTASREQVEALKLDISEARGHLDREAWTEARDGYLAVQEKAQALGIESAYLLWALSLAQEKLGDAEESFRLVCAAVVLDPMHSTLSGRFSEAAEALRRRLEFASKRPERQHPARLYQALLRAGEADAGSHVAMARAHLAQGELEEARKLLESTTLLDPTRGEAWKLLAEVARRRGDAAAAEQAESRLGELSRCAAPYGVPSPTASC